MEYTIGTMVFGNWKIVKLIGQGSYGKVYEIQREDFGLTYKAALKVISIPQNEGEVTSLRQEGMTENETTEYFYSMVQDIVNEFALMFRLKGTTNIVGYEDHVVLKKEDGIGWDVLIRMELLTPLFVYATEHPFTRREVVKLGIDICKALELCKKYNIIHRDLKPENIFVSNNGDYKIGDFGIARTIEKTMSGLSKKGTYSYMAPEVYRGFEYGYTVDMYSLGIVLYRLLNQNRLPFMPAAPAPIKYSDREVALSRRVKGEVITTPFYHDKRLTEIVLKACAYESKERYASPTEMREALEAINLDELDKQVIYPMGEEGTATSQVVEKKVSEVEEETISMQKEDAMASMFAKDDKTANVMGREVSEEQEKSNESTTSKEKLSTGNKVLITIASIVFIILASIGIFMCSTYDANIGYKYVEDSSTDVGDVIIFTDKKLERTIRIELGIWFRPIYTRDVEAITSVFMMQGDVRRALNTGLITDISDFVYMTNIERLNLQSSRGISDISAVENLTKLTELTLSTSGISDISAVENLTNLETLDLGIDQVSDISALENLTQLTWLALCGNQISDISVLENLTNLTHLYLRNNEISDISALENLTNLTYLYLSNNEISDISALENLTNLVRLSLESNNISDISALENLTELRLLYLDYNEISDISALENLTKLGYLSIYDNPIEDYSPIEGLENTSIDQ